VRFTHNSQKLADETPDLTTAGPGVLAPIPGDLVFYGSASDGISHVAVVVAGGKCISADGATSHITNLQQALANPANRVRLHDRLDFRRDLPFHAVHRNAFVDALDGVCL
jgi:hypothetical protein